MIFAHRAVKGKLLAMDIRYRKSILVGSMPIALPMMKLPTESWSAQMIVMIK